MLPAAITKALEIQNAFLQVTDSDSDLSPVGLGIVGQPVACSSFGISGAANAINLGMN